MIAFVLGTRPEIIKCSRVIHEAGQKGIPLVIIHTGQHYTPELDKIFFRELDLPEPVVNLRVGSLSAPEQIGLVMQRLSETLASLKPSVVLVQGDTNSVLAGALTAYKMDIPVAHLEAGLRSHDWTMPEEMNRVLADRLSQWLFCPTETQRELLQKEGINHDGVHVVGNTIVDAVQHYVKVSYEKSDIAERLKITNQSYVLLTLHRPSNVDDPVRLRALLEMLEIVAKNRGWRTVFPVHPRTRAVLDRESIHLGASFIAPEPIGYLDLLRLQASAEMVWTDSGGLQEEACILRVPCVTLRPNTERPETIHVGANVLYAGTDAIELESAIHSQLERSREWENPFGDGKTAEKVVDVLSKV